MKFNDSNHISWCLKQKRGIKLEEPNDNLCNEYIRKAKSALNILISAFEKNEIDWIVSTAYYARYFAFYALLQKCGIKSEIHDCTISLMHFLFIEEKLIDKILFNELQEAKKLRVDIQYYISDDFDKEKIKKDSEFARAFVLSMEEVIDNITKENIDMVRSKLS